MEDSRVIKMKTDEYSSNKDNFEIDGELTVTITLNEYRNLVSISATKDLLVKQAESDKYTREQENRALKEQNEKLKGENYDLLQKLQEIQEKSSENREDDYDTV
jgi:hypothetical protein